MATGNWMIYGANGYTGEIAAHEAKRRGMTPVLAGRRKEAIKSLAEELGFEYKIFSLDDTTRAADAMRNIDIVLHCAGPFSATSKPMLDACLESKTHYTDITGEIDVFEYVHQNTDKWSKGGIVAIPGVGFDVIPSDCLAAMLKRALPDATHLSLAFRSKGKGGTSPGTTKTMVEGIPNGGKIRKDGILMQVPAAYKIEEIPFGCGKGTGVTIPWGDVSTAFYSTGIPNIEVFMGMPASQGKQMKRMAAMGWFFGMGPVQALLKGLVTLTVSGPDAEQRAADNMCLWGKVTNAAGDSVSMTMETPEGYNLTVDGSLTSVQRLLDNPPTPGAYTPSMAFGPDYILELEGTSVQEI